jgi:myo-inositol 2-dehydrogenase/D-chiro-inositol 1-dehydrogenase
LHAEQITAATRAGKAIFCEKPVSLELAEVDRVLAAVAEAGVPFQIGFNQRFDPGHAAVAAAVANGDVGKPHLMRISSRDVAPPPLDYARGSGGIFLDMTIHDFDMARFVVRSEVVEVYAAGRVLIEPTLEMIGDLDTAVVTLVHENGCLTTIDNSRQAVYGYDQRVEVFGSEGMAGSENQPRHGAFVRDRTGVHGATLPYPFLERYAMSYVAEWLEFVAALSDSRAPSVGLADARPPIVIGLAAWRSIRERRPVRIEGISAENATPAKS